MTISTSICRFFNRPLIIGLIVIGFLLIYCVLNLLQYEKNGLIFGNDFDDMDNMILGENNDDMFNDEEADEEFIKFSNRPFLWQIQVMNDISNTNSVELRNVETISDNGTYLKPCRNSIQGKFLIVDDKGYICSRHEILPNGCCALEIVKKSINELSRKSIVKNIRYSCETCNSEGCCAIYEYCVSCCLDPHKIKKKKNLNIGHIRKENLKLRRGRDIFKLRLQSLDHFQLCLAVCRTSSASVQHENIYKNPYQKHCYVLQFSSNYLMQRRKRNTEFFNNNESGLRIASTSSSVVILLDLPFLNIFHLYQFSFIYLQFRLKNIFCFILTGLFLLLLM